MLQFLLSLSRQSNPSILTAGLLPKLPLTHPPFLPEEEEEGDEGGWPSRVEIGEEEISSLNRASCVNGLATLLGGDPHKNGDGESNTCVG